LSIVIIFLTIIGIGCLIGSIFFILSFRHTRIYPPKRMIKQRVMYLLGGAVIIFLLVGFLLFLKN